MLPVDTRTTENVRALSLGRTNLANFSRRRRAPLMCYKHAPLAESQINETTNREHVRSPSTKGAIISSAIRRRSTTMSGALAQFRADTQTDGRLLFGPTADSIKCKFDGPRAIGRRQWWLVDVSRHSYRPPLTTAKARKCVVSARRQFSRRGPSRVESVSQSVSEFN